MERKFFYTIRNELEGIQRDGAIGRLIVNIGNKILKVWNAIPQDYSTLKIVALAVLFIFFQLIHASHYF